MVLPYNYLLQWTEKLLARGQYYFSLGQMYDAFSKVSENALNRALMRLAKKGKVLSIHRGFYLIIAPRFANMGILPPFMFMDDLMNYLGRKYYFGLLTAAALHGSSHHAPQQFFVIIEHPPMRPTRSRQWEIKYVSKHSFIREHLVQIKMETGNIFVSSPVLTALDLIRYEKHIGGLNRAVVVLGELAETIKPEDLSGSSIKSYPISSLQRLGYLLDILEEKELADALFNSMQAQHLSISPNLLRLKTSVRSVRSNINPASYRRWRIIPNIHIDVEP